MDKYPITTNNNMKYYCTNRAAHKITADSSCKHITETLRTIPESHT